MTRKNVTKIFDETDDLLMASKYSEVNKILSEIDVTKLDTDEILAYAAITYTYQDVLNKRRTYLERAQAECRKRGRDYTFQ